MARVDADGDRHALDEGAVFEAVRVRGAGGRSPWLAVSLAASVGALVVIGAAGAGSEPPAAPAGEIAVAASSATGAGADAETGPPATSRPSKRPRPVETGAPASSGSVVAVDLRPVGSHLFVHGDVFSIAVTSVSVSLLDSEGSVAAKERVRMPGGSRALWTDPNARFDIQFAVPDEMIGDGLSVEVTAFDLGGTRVASVRAPVTSPQVPF